METAMNEPTATLPRYFKDETGFCYVATEQLASKPGMTPWNGAVDAAGYAQDAPEPEAPKRSRSQPRRTAREAPPADGEGDPMTEGLQD